MPSGGKRPGAGRPKSTDNTLIKQLREKLAEASDALIDKAVTAALAGDTQMLKFCLDKLIPSLKPVDTPIDPQPIDANGSLVDQSRQALLAMLSGSLTLSEGLQVQAGITALGRMVELEELEARIAQLEQEQKERNRA